MVNVINITPEDSAESARRLIARTRARQVVLALPDGWAELDNMARMRLLQRQAQMRRVEVAIATRHAETRKAAKGVGVPVFYDADDAMSGNWQMTPWLPLPARGQLDRYLPESPHWKQAEEVKRLAQPGKRQARQRHIETLARYRQPLPTWLRWLGTGLMGLLIVLLLGGFTLYVLPAATVTLTPGQEPIVASIRLTADPAQDVADFEAGVLPARVVEVTIEESGSTQTTGTRQKATDRATGSVTFQNLTATPLRIPRETIVSTSTGSRARFRTLNDVELGGGVGARVDAPIESLDPGIQGNVRANTINTVEGRFRLQVRVFNQNATFAGGAQLVSVVAQEDREKLLAEVSSRAEATALQRLQEQLEPGEWLSPDSVQTFVIAQAFGQFNDEEADQLDLTLRILARGSAVEDLLSTNAARNALLNLVPERGRLIADTLTFQREPGATVLGNAVAYTMTARASYVIPIDPVEVRTLIAGLPPEQAILALQNRWPLVRPPDIYRDPEFLSTLPALRNRIQVRIEYQ